MLRSVSSAIPVKNLRNFLSTHTYTRSKTMVCDFRSTCSVFVGFTSGTTSSNIVLDVWIVPVPNENCIYSTGMQRSMDCRCHRYAKIKYKESAVQKHTSSCRAVVKAQVGKTVFEYCLHDEFKTIEPKNWWERRENERSKSFAPFCLFFSENKKTKIFTQFTATKKWRNKIMKKWNAEGGKKSLCTYLSSGNVRRATFAHNENTIIVDELWFHQKQCSRKHTRTKKKETISNHLNDNSESTNDLFHFEIIKGPSTI